MSRDIFHVSRKTTRKPKLKAALEAVLRAFADPVRRAVRG